MLEGERLQAGVEITHRLWGRERGERIQRALEGLSPGLQEYANFGWSLYARPALDAKTRSLCTVAALTVLGDTDELKLHVAGALNNGATREEIEEVLLQMAVYAGMPPAIHAFVAAKDLFAKYQRPADRP